MKERPKSAFYATRGECSPSRRPARPHPPSDVLPTVRMRGKKRHGGGGAEGRRTSKATTTAPCSEGPSSRLFAVQSVKELGRGRKEDGDDYGVDGGGPTWTVISESNDKDTRFHYKVLLSHE